MSEIYVKGMEMPTSCLVCGFRINCDDCEGHECFCAVLHRSIGYMPYNLDSYCKDVPVVPDYRLEDCPLIPVPDHGRLVDLTEIKRRIASCCGDIDCSKIKCDECGVQIAMNKVKAAPTIITASEGGRVMDQFTLTLNSPITDEQFDAITDVDFEKTERVYFNTKHGAVVEFVKAKQPKTNADRIRAMTDEELAKMLSRSGKYFCHWNGYDPHSERCDYGEECEGCWLDWLRQEASD